MSEHIIKKLILDVEYSSEQQCQELRQGLLNVCRNQVEQIIDTHFSQFDSSNDIYQIDSLELDLGEIEINFIYEEIQNRLKTVLEEELENNFVNIAERVTENEGALSSFAHFIETGRLPWWADKTHRQALEQLTEQLVQQKPQILKDLLYKVIKDERRISRLIKQLSERSLMLLTGLYVNSSYSNVIVGLYADLLAMVETISRQATSKVNVHDHQRFSSSRSINRSILREHYWRNIFINLAYSHSSIKKKRLLQDTLVSMARPLGMSYRGFIAKLDEAAEQLNFNSFRFAEETPNLIALFYQELDAVDTKTGTDKTPSDHSKHIVESEPTQTSKTTAFEENEEQVSSSEGTDLSRETTVEDEQSDVLEATSVPVNEEQDEQPDVSKAAAASDNKEQDALADEIDTLHDMTVESDQARLLKTADNINSEDQAIPLEELNISRDVGTDNIASSAYKKQHQDDFDHSSDDEILLLEQIEQQTNRQSPFDTSKQTAKRQALIDQSQLQDAFSQTEEVFIQNAGLVLLWPYLPKLFSRLGYVEDEQFVGQAMMERAVLLLQYLIEPITEISETVLPLNKLLCGMTLETSLEAEFIPMQDELLECENVLNIFARHWQVIQHFSHERIRQDYLQRQGILQQLDNTWRLDVELQTQDILMRKLSWPINFIKLPWMDEPLYVQWSA